MRRVAAILSLLVVTWASARTARGDASATDKATAQALFDEGKRLMEEGQYAKACPKLADSLRLDHGIGTMLNLAICYERNGQTASAWATFKDAAGEARVAGQVEREKLARDRAALLEPKLARLAIVVARESAVDGLLVRRDGEPVPTSTWGLPVPIDPGEHAIEASAPGRKAWATAVAVTPASSSEVAVPPLEPEVVVPVKPPPPAAVPPESPPLPLVAPRTEPSPGAAQRTWGIVGGVAGLVAMGGSLGVGLAARHVYDGSKQASGQDPQCSIGGVCTQQGEEQQKNAQSLAGIGTGLFVGGAVLVAAGVVLFVTAPSKASGTRSGRTGRTERTERTEIELEPTLGGAVLRGTW